MPLRKGTAIRMGGAGEPIEWPVGAYLFRFHKGRGGVCYLTASGGKLPMPYHMVVSSEGDARRKAPGVVASFEGGKVPMEGVFRKLQKAMIPAPVVWKSEPGEEIPPEFRGRCLILIKARISKEEWERAGQGTLFARPEPAKPEGAHEHGSGGYREITIKAHIRMGPKGPISVPSHIRKIKVKAKKQGTTHREPEKKAAEIPPPPVLTPEPEPVAPTIRMGYSPDQEAPPMSPTPDAPIEPTPPAKEEAPAAPPEPPAISLPAEPVAPEPPAAPPVLSLPATDRMPDLSGSEKQVKWANDIRRSFVQTARSFAREPNDALMRAKMQTVLETFAAGGNKAANAKFWIDHGRSMNPHAPDGAWALSRMAAPDVEAHDRRAANLHDAWKGAGRAEGNEQASAQDRLAKVGGEHKRSDGSIGANAGIRTLLDRLAADPNHAKAATDRADLLAYFAKYPADLLYLPEQYAKQMQEIRSPSPRPVMVGRPASETPAASSGIPKILSLWGDHERGSRFGEGSVVKTKEGWAVVTGVRSRYIREDGLSFGIDADSGWKHTYDLRPATEAEAATAEAGIEAKRKKAADEKAAEKALEQSQLDAIAEQTRMGHVASSHPPAGATWSEPVRLGPNRWFKRGTLPDGSTILETYAGLGDDWRDTYYMPHREAGRSHIAFLARSSSVPEPMEKLLASSYAETRTAGEFLRDHPESPEAIAYREKLAQHGDKHAKLAEVMERAKAGTMTAQEAEKARELHAEVHGQYGAKEEREQHFSWSPSWDQAATHARSDVRALASNLAPLRAKMPEGTRLRFNVPSGPGAGTASATIEGKIRSSLGDVLVTPTGERRYVPPGGYLSPEERAKVAEILHPIGVDPVGGYRSSEHARSLLSSGSYTPPEVPELQKLTHGGTHAAPKELGSSPLSSSRHLARLNRSYVARDYELRDITEDRDAGTTSARVLFKGAARATEHGRVTVHPDGRFVVEGPKEERRAAIVNALRRQDEESRPAPAPPG